VKFFDTSVLVAAVTVQHVHHSPSLRALLDTGKAQARCAAHSLAELYSTLTRLPGNQRMDSDQALLIIDEMRSRFKAVFLDADEYYSVIAGAAAAGIVGGMIYDALIARCALKSRADVIYTWNTGHFQQLGSEVAKRLQSP